MIILWLNFKVSTQEAHPTRAGMEVNAVKLRKLREHRALFLRELSALSGVNYNSIWRIEVGRTGAKPRTVRRLAEALGVEPCELLREG